MTVSGIKDGAGSTLTVIEGEMNVREYIMGIIKPSIRNTAIHLYQDGS